MEGDEDDDVIVLPCDLKVGIVTVGTSAAYDPLVPLESVIGATKLFDWEESIKSRSVAGDLIPSPIANQHQVSTNISPRCREVVVHSRKTYIRCPTSRDPVKHPYYVLVHVSSSPNYSFLTRQAA